ncbi:MAG TPA: alanine--tRNA ligase [Candidatus Eisenbacteria bacterium]|nr:alanine--tRNA ligase [Candidatus Eisenbacteria bacterium]
MTGDQIRQSFLDFFRLRGHTIVPSAPLVPANDPSLLFTNAGMVQFKHVFLGSETRPYTRAADTQKCLRISGKHNDLEQVGRDTYHHTLFEMLGNWSFGDYYKREAIGWAWELLTKVWKLPKDKLFATVYTTDDEADALWREVTDIGHDRISRFEKENFWEMADTGPCGPCTEIHIDRGPDACDHEGQPHRCQVNGDCARYIEIWNLVFIQNNRDASGTLSELPAKHVDTGMGFERIAAVIQNVPSNYDIDLFQTIIQRTERLAAKRYRANEKDDVSLRVIADHSRAVTFLVGEGIVPSNEGRGYVLRRLLRRAARHGKLLGMERPFLWEVVDAVVDAMGGAFPEIVEARARVKEVVRTEEERFAQTLDRGLALLSDEIAATRKRGATTLSGAVAFKLSDTFGFPLDLTEDILAGEGLVVDKDGFERAMDEQRERARGAQKFVDAGGGPELAGLGERTSRFVGDRVTESESEVLALVADGVQTRGPVREGSQVDVVTAETPFYAESGGQVGDRGWITTASGARIEVQDTHKIAGAVVAHRGVVRQGAIAVGDRVRLAIDAARREAARLNHSATHLVHGVLRRRLGPHVKQAGSLVDPQKLRFDFNHHKPVSPDELQAIEDEVNAEIRANVEVTQEEMSYDDAIRAGALAFFGDKYGDRVRVVRMGEFSTELCGGTHVQRTGDIGVFKLDGESGVAAGVRRIEAATGAGALGEIRRHEALLGEIAHLLRAGEQDAKAKLEKLLAQSRELEKRIAELQGKLAGGASRDVMADAKQVNGITVLATKVEGLDDKGLRDMADKLRDRIKSGVVVLGGAQGDKVMLLATVTKDLVGTYHAGNIIKRLAPMVGGGGGGRPDFAQAGGKDPTKLDAALAAAYELVGAGS